MPTNCIRIAGLNDGEHRQAFEIKDKFFKAYEDSEVKAGKFIVNTLVVLRGLDRKLTINIEGIITNLLCDYCTKRLEWAISTTLNFVIKESKNETKSTDEMIYVFPNQHQLDINQLIFEMINLSVPNKRIHNKSEQKMENATKKCYNWCKNMLQKRIMKQTQDGKR